MRMMSYAQNREDVLLSRCFPEATGFYIDVGAATPLYHSVTKWFATRGWTGINIEPHPEFFKLIQADRPNEVNVNAAVSAVEGKIVYYEVLGSIGCSTVNPELADQIRRTGAEVVEHVVRTVTLAQICEQYVRGPIEFLKIDAEGHERQVLESMDFRRWQPKVLVIETTAVETWKHLPLTNGYLFACFDGLNQYYVHEQHRELLPRLAAPANCLDDYEIFEYVERIRNLESELTEAHRKANSADDRPREAKSVPAIDDNPSGPVSRNAYLTLLSLYRENQRHLEALRQSALTGNRVS